MRILIAGIGNIFLGDDAFGFIASELFSEPVADYCRLRRCFMLND